MFWLIDIKQLVLLNFFLKTVDPNQLASDKARPPQECIPENYFSYFSTKTYVVGTQKNGLDETVLLSTQNISLN